MTGDLEQTTFPVAKDVSFDLSKKKKKKKNKTPASAMTSFTDDTPPPPQIDSVTTALASQSINDPSSSPQPAEDSEQQLEPQDKQERQDDQPQDQQDEQQQQQQPLDFSLPSFGGKKKKKKKKKVDFGDDPTSALEENGVSSTTEDGKPTENKRRVSAPQPWDDEPDRDYTYGELISRAFQFLHGKNPALAAGASQRKRIRMELPQVAREGTKKTVFLNFGSICKTMHRQQDHVLAYMCAELGTTGNIQEGGRLVIKGRFGSEGIANVLKRYMLEYAVCTSCRSPDTVLMRDANTRLYFVSCESCGAKRSVAPIRQGFMAQVEKRKK